MRHITGTAALGLGLSGAGLVSWGTAIGLQPALTAAGFAAMDRGGLPYMFNSETHRVLLLDAHDLRLATLVVVAAGAALVVAGLPRLAARPAPPLLAVGAVLLLANLVWGLVGAGPAATAPMVVTTGIVAVLAARFAARRWPATGAEIRGNATLRLVPALFAAGALYALTEQTATHPVLRPFVPPAYLDLLTAVRVLLVVTAVAAALTVGRRWFAPRLVAGVALAAVVITVGAPVAGVFGAGVLVLAWLGEPGRFGPRALGAAVAAAVPLVAGSFLMLVGIMVGVLSLLLTGAEIGADGMPRIGSGLLLGAVLVAVDQLCTRSGSDRGTVSLAGRR